MCWDEETILFLLGVFFINQGILHYKESKTTLQIKNQAPLVKPLDMSPDYRVYIKVIIQLRNFIMKIANSLKTLKLRHKGCKVVRRRGRTYVINKENPRFKARQG